MRNAGRATLWAGVALVLWRGLGDIFAGSKAMVPRGPSAASSAPPFPDGEARAFAVAFARVYLAPSDRRAGRQTMLARFASQSLSDQAASETPPRSPGAAVADATVARKVSLGESRAIITVATFTETGRRRYLAVPVARDERGGLVVYDLPAFVAPPPLGAAEALAAMPLSGPDGAAVEALVRRFLRAFLHDDAGALAYLVAPGAHVVPLETGLSLDAVEEVGRLSGSPARGMHLAVVVRVRDLPARAAYRQRYRLAVVRSDRWYVTSVAGGPRR